MSGTVSNGNGVFDVGKHTSTMAVSVSPHSNIAWDEEFTVSDGRVEPCLSKSDDVGTGGGSSNPERVKFW